MLVSSLCFTFAHAVLATIAAVDRPAGSSYLDQTFSALSDPTRRAILERLARGPATLSELAHPFRISLPGLLKHVRILEDAHLVVTRKQGRTRQCHLGADHLEAAADWIHTYRHRWQSRLDRLEDYIDRHQPPQP